MARHGMGSRLRGMRVNRFADVCAIRFNSKKSVSVLNVAESIPPEQQLGVAEIIRT